MKIRLTKGIVDATLVSRTPGGVWVRLLDGRIIHRKRKQIIEEVK